MRTKHGKSNYRRLLPLLRDTHGKTRTWSYADYDLTIEPLGKTTFRLTLRNDVIVFFIHEEAIIPYRITNVIEDLDMITFVTGTNIPKRDAMIKADERLYNVCNHHAVQDILLSKKIYKED